MGVIFFIRFCKASLRCLNRLIFSACSTVFGSFQSAAFFLNSLGPSFLSEAFFTGLFASFMLSACLFLPDEVLPVPLLTDELCPDFLLPVDFLACVPFLRVPSSEDFLRGLSSDDLSSSVAAAGFFFFFFALSSSDRIMILSGSSAVSAFLRRVFWGVFAEGKPSPASTSAEDDLLRRFFTVPSAFSPFCILSVLSDAFFLFPLLFPDLRFSLLSSLILSFSSCSAISLAVCSSMLCARSNFSISFLRS